MVQLAHLTTEVVKTLLSTVDPLLFVAPPSSLSCGHQQQISPSGWAEAKPPATVSGQLEAGSKPSLTASRHGRSAPEAGTCRKPCMRFNRLRTMSSWLWRTQHTCKTPDLPRSVSACFLERSWISSLKEDQISSWNAKRARMGGQLASRAFEPYEACWLARASIFQQGSIPSCWSATACHRTGLEA